MFIVVRSVANMLGFASLSFKIFSKHKYFFIMKAYGDDVGFSFCEAATVFFLEKSFQHLPVLMPHIKMILFELNVYYCYIRNVD